MTIPLSAEKNDGKIRCVFGFPVVRLIHALLDIILEFLDTSLEIALASPEKTHDFRYLLDTSS